MMTLSASTRKLLIRLFVWGTVAAGATPVFAGETGSEHTAPEVVLSNAVPSSKQYRPRYTFWNNYVGDLYLSGGFSKEFNYGSQVGGKCVLDYMVADQVSIGAQTGLYLLHEEGVKAYSPYVGIRLSYHLVRAKLHRRQNPWNVYMGVSAEAELGGGTKDWHEKDLLADLHFGARYRLTSQLFLWGEVALNNASVGFSVAL